MLNIFKKSRSDLIAGLIFFALILVITYNHFFLDIYARPALKKSSLSDLEKEILSHLKEMTELLISLSTAVFALIGYFAVSGKTKKTWASNNKIKLPMVLAFCFAALSIDFGYVLMEKWVEMLSLGIFRPNDNLVRTPQNLQIISFLLALIFVGVLVFNSLFIQSKNESK